MLIRNAEIYRMGLADLRMTDGVISEIGTLSPRPGESYLDADGGALLPGLHDHHIHLSALAARADSIFCGPPEIFDRAAFAARLSAPGEGWLRGIGYHESVAGMLDAADLDAIVANRPVRIQHRSGRMWFLNSAAMADLLSRAEPPPGLERSGGVFSGRLFDEDRWLRGALASQMPCFHVASHALARHGVTALTDMSPDNDLSVAAHFGSQRRSGALLQRVTLAGSLALAEGALPVGITLGPAKLHLHEAQLPNFDVAADFVRRAHAQGRAVAVHCATEVELVFALAALEEAGVIEGDRIEHASVAPDILVDEVARLGLAVCTQPHFIAERGDAYRADLPAEVWPLLYRLRAFLEAGVKLSAGSDAPFGKANPWASMAAAVRRALGESEEVSPEEALNLYIDADISVGGEADLVLLRAPWTTARLKLSSSLVCATFIAGNRVYEAPGQSGARIDPLS